VLAGTLLVALVLLAWLAWPALASVLFPQPQSYYPEGRISFVRRTGTDRSDLYIVNPDGTHQERATTDIPIEGVNTWSPDGRRILVQASVGGTSTVVRLDIGADNKASNAVQLTADARGDSAFPSWSPDGSLIAFQSKRDGADYQLFVMDPDGNNKHRLTDGKGYAGQPSWSPDGKTIAYVQGEKADAGTPKEIYLVPKAGGTPTKLTSLGKDLGRPLWSPAGGQIIFAQSVGDRNRAIYSIDPQGKTEPKLLVDQGFNSGAAFSRDGKTIVYYSITTGSDILTVPAAGGPITNLTHLTPEDYQPAWSPDGRNLTWAGRRTDSFRIIVANADGSNPHEISSGDGSDTQPSWGAPVK
jgi:TolB protein